MITTVTLNPMLDKTVSVEQVRVGGVVRASGVEMVVGGKGVNVSRQLARLGQATVATGFAGGEIGTILERLLDEEGIRHSFVRVKGMTREGVTYRAADGTQTAVFEPPHQVSAAEIELLAGHCGALLEESSWVVCSGSAPCAGAEGVYRDLLSAARAQSVRTVLDSYGAPLLLGLEAAPTIVKPNRDEYERTFGVALTTDTETARALDRLVGMDVRIAIITNGPGMFFAATREGKWRITPPKVATVNATGSGDSLIAGLLYALEEGWQMEHSLSFAAAAGAANARVWAVARSTLPEIAALMPGVAIEEFHP